MKLYDSIGPNPRVVRMFVAEKGMTLDVVKVDIVQGENRRGEYLGRNPSGTTPLLELDDGTCLGETIAICEYLEELQPSPSLIGTTPEQRARTRMWTRRIDLDITTPMTAGFRAAEGRQMFEPRMKLVGAEGAADLKALAADKLLWLDRVIGDQDYIAGDSFGMADIALFCFVDFGGQVGQPLPAEATRLAAWFDRVKARPSAAA